MDKMTSVSVASTSYIPHRQGVGDNPYKKTEERAEEDGQKT